MNKMHPGGCWKLQSGLLYPLVKGRREGIEREDGRCVVLPHLAFFAMVLLQQRGAGVKERLSAVAARLPACPAGLTLPFTRRRVAWSRSGGAAAGAGGVHSLLVPLSPFCCECA